MQDPTSLQLAHQRLGVTMLYMGDLLLAEEQLTQEVVDYELERERSSIRLYGQAPSSMQDMWLGQVKWLLGYPDQASKHLQEALGIAKEVAHPFTHAFVLSLSFTFYYRSGAMQELNECLDTVFPLAEEQNFRMFSVQASLFQGYLWTKSGKIPEGIDAIIKAMEFLKRMGSQISRPYNLSNLAEAQGLAGEPDQGLATVEQALAHVKETDEHYTEADILRVKGDLLLLSAESDNRAEECYRQSLDVARSQSAKSWELRTSLSLARLWQKQGKQTEARGLLAEIYGWFTEGFDTPDLIDAKALLEELS